jgi:NAD(P)-dependent dehydrogenase (short-subunit alcohol dehydrogenase family)
MKGRILVTGAALRIGKAIAIALAGSGAQVVVHYRNSAKAAEGLASELNAKHGAGVAVTARADLSDRAAVAALIPGIVQAHGPLTGLVNSASVFEDDRIETLSRESWNRHFDTNLWAPVALIQAFARQLPHGAEGSVVNIVDQGVLRFTPEFLSYTASKSALWTLTQTLAQALAPRIRVNAVAPGPTLASIHQSPEQFAAQAASTLLQRPSEPEDIAKAVVYLMSAGAVTGHLIPVDSGQHLSWRSDGAPWNQQ